jgi:hypothetical protein
MKNNLITAQLDKVLWYNLFNLWVFGPWWPKGQKTYFFNKLREAISQALGANFVSIKYYLFYENLQSHNQCKLSATLCVTPCVVRC